jgi:predicted N-acetyltransferase YhbS
MTAKKIQFRDAVPADRAQLIPLINTAFSIESFFESDGTRTDEERLRAAMQKGSILVAESADGKLLASIYMERRGRRGYLGMLAVKQARQREGIGRQIVEAAEDRFRQAGCEAVDITVLSPRTELPPIYRRFGYVETGTEEFKSPRPLRSGVACHCIVMSKRL